MQETTEKKQFPKEVLWAFAITFFNEFSRIHRGKNLWQALFTASFTAMLLAIEAHIVRGKNKQFKWKYGCLSALVFVVTFLLERQRLGPGAEWTAAFSSSLTITIWISAFLFLASHFWRQAEGQTE